MCLGSHRLVSGVVSLMAQQKTKIAGKMAVAYATQETINV